MRLYPKEVELKPDEGFTPPKDIFGRKSFGDQLTRIVKSLEGPSVLLLDAPWGSGKTTFLRMWRGELTKEGVSCTYFDAFANDYQEDAFLAFASQIIEEADERAPNSKAIKDFKTKAFQVAKILGRAALRVSVHALSAGMVQGEALEKAAESIAKDAGDETANALDEVLKARLENHASDRKIFEEFRLALSTLASDLSSSKKNYNAEQSLQNTSATPLVFIIDELDRCRPSFALEILEKVKHFFSVPNVVFILVSSLPQLQAMVKYNYGDIDALTYLEKFYHLRILFPSGRSDRLDLGAATYLNYIGCPAAVSKVIALFCQVHPLSFRQLERIAAYAKIVSISSPPNALVLPQIIALLCILKTVRPDLYAAARGGKISYKMVEAFFNFDTWRNPHDPSQRDGTGENVENWWRIALNEINNEELAREYFKSLGQYYMNAPSSIIPNFCDLMDGFSFPDQRTDA